MATEGSPRKATDDNDLTSQWYSEYRAEVAESGDPDGFLAALTDRADVSLPGSSERAALASLLERLREEGLDGVQLEGDDEA
jgi:hypothetical protein